MAVKQITKRPTCSTYEMVIDIDVFHDDVEDIETILGSEIGDINHVDGIVIVELLTQIFCNDTNEDDPTTLKSLIQVVKEFLHVDQAVRLDKILSKRGIV